jgi:hypothetical protein
LGIINNTPVLRKSKGIAGIDCKNAKIYGKLTVISIDDYLYPGKAGRVLSVPIHFMIEGGL